MIKLKKVVLGTIVASLVLANTVTAFADEIFQAESRSTTVYFDTTTKIPDKYKERARIKNNNLDEIDFKSANPDTLATGVGLYDGLQFQFGIVEYLVINNKDLNVPDLRIVEASIDGQGNIGEGVRLYAVNYNGTNTIKHVATVYNETAQTNIDAYNAKNGTSDKLESVAGSKVESKLIPNTNNYFYGIDVYFPEEFIYCDSVLAIDITDELKKYGGNGQDSLDGFDIAGIQACNVVKADFTNYKADTENKINKIFGKTINVVADSYKLTGKTEMHELIKLATGKYPDGTVGNNKAGEINNDYTSSDGNNSSNKASDNSSNSNNNCNVDKSPKTGDSTMIIALSVGLLISTSAIVSIFIYKKRRVY